MSHASPSVPASPSSQPPTQPSEPSSKLPGPQPSLGVEGGLAFMITAFIGRLPPATIQMGLLMYVSSSGLGLALAGVTVAAVGLGSAVGAPWVGRLVDRFGALPVVAVSTVIQVAGLLAVFGAVHMQAPHALILISAALVGAANPQVGAIARSHWSLLSRLNKRPVLISRALGYETAADETSFILGPVLGSLAVGLLGPDPALLGMVAWVLVGQGMFLIYLLMHRQFHGPAHHPATSDGSPARINMMAMIPPLIVCLCVGTIFGSTQTALASINAMRDTEALTGLLYGCMGAGSAVASLLVNRLPRSFSLPLRVACGAALIAVMCLVLLRVPGPGVIAVIFTAMGLGVGTILVSAFTRGEAIAPSHRMATVMTTFTTCLVLGVSFGSGVGGVISQEPGRGFVLTLGAALVALITAVALSFTRPALRRRRTVT